MQVQPQINSKFGQIVLHVYSKFGEIVLHVYSTFGQIVVHVIVQLNCFYNRQIEYIYNGVKSSSKYLTAKQKKRYYMVMRMEDVDACCIRMFECFLEAAPQLVLQIYILMQNRQEESWIFGMFACRTFLLSLQILEAVVTLYSIYREKNYYTKNK